MVQFDLQKINFSIQGQQTMLFWSEFFEKGDQLSDIIDISKSYDPRNRKLPVLGGKWDQIRTIRRGSAKIKIKDFEIEVWPKRNFNRYSDRLLINFNDFEYTQRLMPG
jgi:hypothetical protein